MKFPAIQLPPLNNDMVKFDVDVDNSACGSSLDKEIVSRLTDLEKNGIETTISTIVGFSSLYFVGIRQVANNRADSLFRLKEAWNRLSSWGLKSENNKLVFNDNNHPGERQKTSELAAIGVGLLCARLIYNVPLRYWVPTNQGRFDYHAPTSTSHAFKVEVRGRFDRKNWKAACEEVRKKIGTAGDYRNAAGIVFAPRTSSKTRTADIQIMDPVGNDRSFGKYFRERSILQHYAHYCLTRGSIEFGRTLADIAEASDFDIEKYQETGIDGFKTKSLFSDRFDLFGQEYHGVTIRIRPWDSVLQHLRKKKPNIQTSYLFDGIDVRILEFLRTGKLHSITNLEARTDIQVTDYAVRMLTEDGRLNAFYVSSTP